MELGNEAHDVELGNEAHDVELGGKVHGGGQGGGELGGRVHGMVRDDKVHDGHGIDELENVLLDEPHGHMAKA